MAMTEAIKSLVDANSLSTDQATAAMEEIMSGGATPAQIGAYLAALRFHGESPELVAASASVMQAHAEAVPAADVIDICGTGGDMPDTFNVSTAAGFVVAGAGVRVAKHGNRAASSKCGSADILEALGAKTDLGGDAVAKVIDDCGFCFIFAQRFHPAMRHVGPARREMGVRTIFNMLGPLTNPATPRGQLAGVGAAQLAPIMAEAFRIREMPRAMVVHSEDGLDEVSPAMPTRAWVVEEGSVSERVLNPSEFELPSHSLAEVAGGTPDENARVLRDVLEGRNSPVADFVLLNAAAALFVAGEAGEMAQGTALARDAIASGRAAATLDRYVALTKEFSNG
ncbi:MAG TPA: anthranilate phosphoribosyltransferase [Dehalococcoidia bacterium]|nr:anthranilate phosphoribosyltransferase [Dehalococcoidia bacterium]